MVTRDEVTDFLFRGELSEVDPEVAELIRHETARQARHLIMIPSSSTIPEAVREALSSAFHNIYAEGYPLDSYRTMTEQEILDYNARLPEFRRESDQRYYKGTEYANIVEGLARRRMAELFATDKYSANQLYVNVQPLSGAPANNAIYTALLNVGDTVMGMDLIEGGHLTHGSPVNRSGKYYKIVSYGINPETGDIDYDRMAALAQEHRPKMIIGGYSSFPWQADWGRYREIADSVGAYLLADVAHVAGLIAAEAYPSPVGVADVISFTTHKTFGGPRGAVIITHRKDLATKIDRAVFPGEQGGPHVNTFAALAVAAKLARTEKFRELQHRTVSNAARLAEKLAARGLRIPFGGTTTHIINVDCNSVVGPDGTVLTGDMAARILDLVGVVANRQTIPGDTSALRPNGLRLGTPWITQRGFGSAEIDELGDIIADVLLATVPISYHGRKGKLARAKIDFETLQQARLRVRDLVNRIGIDTSVPEDEYPHVDYLPAPDAGENWQRISLHGERVRDFLESALTTDVLGLKAGEGRSTLVLSPQGDELARGEVKCISPEEYELVLNRNAGRVATWFRSLSDGFMIISEHDVYGKLPGPIDVRFHGGATPVTFNGDEAVVAKAYYVGLDAGQHEQGNQLPVFVWNEPEQAELLTTSLHSLHKELGAKMVPFAGYDMPVWYTSVTNEHLAVRQQAGIFDVTHMGVFDVKGAGAARFLDAVTSNDVYGLAVGESHYTYFLDVEGIPLDDLMIYRLAEEHYLVVVNASNNDKNWAWLQAVKNQSVLIDPEFPGRVVKGDDFVLRDLRMPEVGAEMRVDVALQGPESLNILLKLESSPEAKAALKGLAWAQVTQVTLGGYDLIVSRTGYTGERVAYEIFVHPEKAPALFGTLVELGATPCGLAARDSLRTEAGLPLYGHELEGPLNLGPADAGFASYVKLWKPFFIGKSAHLRREQERDAEVVRFRLNSKGARPPHQGDPLVDNRGRVVGIVTSCSIDSEGYQLGQAYVKFEFAERDTELAVFSGSARMKGQPDVVALGRKFTLPEPVTILSRFPARKK